MMAGRTGEARNTNYFSPSVKRLLRLFKREYMEKGSVPENILADKKKTPLLPPPESNEREQETLPILRGDNTGSDVPETP